jgi:Icc protein
MKKVLSAGTVQAPGYIDADGWHIILLDSTAPGRKEGVLSRQELERLAGSLELYPDCYALIALHHHPVPIGSRWMDTMILENPESLFRVLDEFPQVRGVIWGHVHQAFERERHGVRLLGAPATSVQFTPLSTEFSLDGIPAGYRWLELGVHGEINTGIVRIG